MSVNDFEELLLEAVDEGLSSLGNSGKKAIYFYLEQNFKIKKPDISNKIESFAQAIEKIFGLGAKFLELLIMRRFYEKIGVSLEWDESIDFTFIKYLKAARQNFLEKAKILIVDDEENIVKALVTILKKEGYIVDTAKNGEEAIKKSNTRFYNLALIDIRLPDMEGTELLTRMKETTPKMVKIMVTGYPSQQNAVEAVNRGADGYILKPVKPESLLKIIKEHLDKQRESMRYSQEKVADFIETRARELEEEKTV